MPVTPDQTGSTILTTGVTTASVDITAASTGSWVYLWANLSNGGAVQVTDPSSAGWTKLASANSGAAVGSTVAIYRRQKQVGDTTFSFTWTNNAKGTFSWSSYLGLNATTPDEQATCVVNDVTNRAAVPTPTATPTGGGEWALAFFGQRSSNSAAKPTAWTPDAALVERKEADNNAAATSPWLGADIEDSNGAVTIAAHSYTATSNQTQSHDGSGILFLIPASSASYTQPNIFVPHQPYPLSVIGSATTLMPQNPASIPSTYVKGLTATATVTALTGSVTVKSSFITLFQQQPIGSVLTSDPTAYTLGMQFVLSSPASALGVWFYSAAGAVILPQTVHIYKVTGSGTGTVVVQQSASWSGVAGSGWVKSPITATNLQAGVNYKVAVSTTSPGGNWYAGFSHYWDGAGPGASGFTNSIITAPNNAGGDQGQDTFSTVVPSYPHTSFNANNYWVDIEVTPLAFMTSPVQQVPVPYPLNLYRRYVPQVQSIPGIGSPPVSITGFLSSISVVSNFGTVKENISGVVSSVSSASVFGTLNVSKSNSVSSVTSSSTVGSFFIFRPVQVPRPFPNISPYPLNIVTRLRPQHSNQAPQNFILLGSTAFVSVSGLPGSIVIPSHPIQQWKVKLLKPQTGKLYTNIRYNPS